MLVDDNHDENGRRILDRCKPPAHLHAGEPPARDETCFGICESLRRCRRASGQTGKLDDLRGRRRVIAMDAHLDDALGRLGGKIQVPYLVDPNGPVALYESRDILDYLDRTYAA